MRLHPPFALAFILLSASLARADHGKGAVGGRTISPRTLGPGEKELEVGMKFQSSEPVSDQRILDETQKGHDLHSADWMMEYSLGVSYGISDRMAASITLPYSITSGFRAGEVNETPPPNVLMTEADRISGLGDLVFLLKDEVSLDPVEVAVLAGVKMPTGATHEESDDGEHLEPDHQPGSGSWDALIGVAVGKQVDDWMFSASAMARITTEGRHEFKHGNTLVIAARAEYQFSELGSFPRFYASMELAADMARMDSTDGDRNEDSGGVILWISPGVKMKVDSKITLGLSVGLPLYQGLYGEQHEERFEILFGATYAF